MAPRANWKGTLRLSLVTCPIELYPATSEREKVRFNQINSKTGNRIKMQRVDAGSGDEVDYADIVKGYEVDKDQYITVSDEELKAVEIESSRTLNIEKFVDKAEIDPIYFVRPYYIAPDGDVGAEAFAVIREAVKKEGMVAIGRVVLTSREHIIALEPRGKGFMGMLLRYPYEVRNEKEYFDDIPDEKIPKDMLELATTIIRRNEGHFEPDKFEDRYENALRDLVKKKSKGVRIQTTKPSAPAKVINLMDALRRSVGDTRSGNTSRRKPAATRRAANGRAQARRKAS